jgi:hypothetical protein
MEREQVIALAREAGFPNKDGNLDFWFNMEMLERFAALVEESKKQQLIDLCEREIEQLSINNDAEKNKNIELI